MFRRKTCTTIGRLLLAALLFAQAAVVAASCEMPDRSPAQVFSQPESMPCHEEPTQNANICLAHCLSADQSADTPQIVVPAWSGTAPLTIAVVHRWSGRAAFLQHVLPLPAAPPPRILFQTFLI